MKRLLAMLMLLSLLPLAALAGVDAPLTWERQEKKFIDFPTLDGWRGHFSSVTKWTIVTPENLEENWALVSGRGDPEAEIRATPEMPSSLFISSSLRNSVSATVSIPSMETAATVMGSIEGLIFST